MSVLILTVDEVMRTLSNDGQYPFVENDKTIDIVRFAINTGFTDVVLDEHSALRVMYQRPGESQVRAQTLTYHDTDGLRNYYDWHLLSADLEHKGTITCALCILRTDGDVEEWHTTPYQIRVLGTIHTDDSDEGDETITPTVAQRVAVLETMIQRVASGAPVVVSSTSAMTDTNQIYVLSTNGRWYYHNGSAWVAGGTYGAVATDTTLTQSGAPADAKVVGDEIDELNGRLQQITTDFGSVPDLKTALSYAVDTVHTEQSTDILPNITWTEGYYAAPNGAINTSSTNKYSNKIPVQEGDIITLLPASSNFRWICAYSGDTAVADSGTQNVSSYTVPSGIDGLVLTAYISPTYAPTAVYQKREIAEYINVNDAEIEDISDRLESVEEVIKTERYIDDVVKNITPSMTGGAVSATGVTVAYQDFEYTHKISVTEGALIEALSNGASVSIRFLCAYNGNVAMSESGSSTEILKYTVPSGIDGIIVTVRKKNNVDTIRVTTPTGKVGAYVKPIPLGFMAESGSLSSGDKLTLPYMQVKLYNRIVFNANVSSFSSIFYSMRTVKVEVDSTNLLITNGSGTALTPVPHGLTIGKNITLIIENETEEYISHIRICSDGDVFDYTSKFYAPSVNAAQYVQSSGSTLTECVLSWVSQNINAPIWIFGDSYLSLYNVRWTYYLIQDGYTKNVMLNGYAGQASATDYNALVNLLETTTPKMVVWCLGMNDPDTSDAVNESWKKIYDKVIERQKEYGFELVLYTVPTTPTMNNRFKNAIVRESGYRYIEADKAVRINDNGDWISGTLNSDNVHPTETGAKVLYNRILADLPEIMCNR